MTIRTYGFPRTAANYTSPETTTTTPTTITITIIAIMRITIILDNKYGQYYIWERVIIPLLSILHLPVGANLIVAVVKIQILLLPIPCWPVTKIIRPSSLEERIRELSRISLLTILDW